MNEVLLLRHRDSLESSFCCHTGVKYNGMLSVLHTKIFDQNNKDAKKMKDMLSRIQFPLSMIVSCELDSMSKAIEVSSNRILQHAAGIVR